MKELPIISSAPPAKAAAKATNSESARQDSQEFGNVLARQVSDASKPAEATPPSSPHTDKQTLAEENTEATPAAIAADAQTNIPTDMLATLLAQQAPTAIAQTNSMIPPTTPGQTDVDAQLSIAPAAVENSMLLEGKNEQSNLLPLTTLPQSASQLSVAQGTHATHQPAVAMPGKSLNEKSQVIDFNQSNNKSDILTMQDGSIKELSSSAPPSNFMPLAATSSAATINQLQVNAPVTQAAWAEEFSQKITWLTSQKNQSAELHLNPPQLGPLDVVVKINGDQASAMFSSPHAAVREAIEQALPRLREMLADSGIMLGNAMVNDHASKNEQHMASPQTRNNAKSSERLTMEAENTQQVRVTPLSRHNGMVDTFA